MELTKTQKENLIKLIKLVIPVDKIITGKNKDIDLLGSTLHESWLVKRKINNKISNTKIDNYYLKALKNGALGGKILGAGNGGFFLFYIKSIYRKRLEKSLKKLRKLEFKFDYKGTAITYNDEKKN